MAEGTGKAIGIGEVARRTGISERVLRYLDEKGILCPSAVTRGGWRRYTDKDLLRLQEVQILREAGFALGEIAGIVRSPGYDPAEALERAQAILEARAGHMRQVMDLVKRQRQERTSDGFDLLLPGEETALRAAYKQHLWTSGEPAEPGRADPLDEDERGFVDTARQILGTLSGCADEGPHGEMVQKCVRAWQGCISKYCCPCDDQTLLCLGYLYARPGRLRDYINGFGTGDLAQLMCEAIQVHVGHLRP